MVDSLSKAEPSELMSRVRSKDTKPELVVRRLVHNMGYRYHLHDRHLPGTPDLVFPPRKRAIFVHGCFWHGMPTPPASSPACPSPGVISGNPSLRAIDVAMPRTKSGFASWAVLVIWECQVGKVELIGATLRNFLAGDDASS